MDLRKDGRVYEPAEDSWLLCATLERAATRFPELHGTVLEMGTGSGIVALTLAALGGAVTATDLNPHAIALARRNARAAGHYIELSQGDLFEPVGDRRFDARTPVRRRRCAGSAPARGAARPRRPCRKSLRAPAR